MSRAISVQEWVDASGVSPSAAMVHVRLLGGFRVERGDVTLPDLVWQRRSAKRLTKLVATHPDHALHREQILEILWRDLDIESARNAFAKALHAARRALEPTLLPRESSAYLRLRDDVLRLNMDNVVVDADQFQLLAETALRLGTVSEVESALAAYGGELLPEDRYEDWSAARRASLSELHAQLLLRMADVLDRRGSYAQAAECLRAVLVHDPTREEVHRRLMRLYSKSGSRGQAVRQFRICQEVLRRELDMAPDRETELLYEDIRANRVPARSAVLESGLEQSDPQTQLTATDSHGGGFVGRAPQLDVLRQALARAEEGNGGTILISGEAGVGKTRLVAEFVAEARARGVFVLGGGHVTRGRANHLPYGPFVGVLEGYLAGAHEAERTGLALRYPALAQLIPSLGNGTPAPVPTTDSSADASVHLMIAIARLLTELVGTMPVVVVLGDLYDADSTSIELLQFLASLAPERHWLMVGTLRDELVETGSELRRRLDVMAREQLCVRLELEPLWRSDCDELVRATLPGGVVSDGLLSHLYAVSLGNPLFVEELVRDLDRRGELALSDGHWQGRSSRSPHVPGPVRALVTSDIARLEGGARNVIGLAAAAANEITLTDLRAASAALQPPLSGVELLDALDQALKAGMLEERGDAYAFRHPLVRAAYLEDLSHHRRLELEAALGHAGVSALGQEQRLSSDQRGPRKIMGALRHSRVRT